MPSWISVEAMVGETHRRAAEELLAARRAREPIACLPPACRPRTPDEAYAIQAAVFEAGGDTLAGFKIGATSRKAQDYLGLDAPFHGRVGRQGLLASPAEMSAGDFIFRLIEPEFAFRLGSDLPARAAPYGRDEIADAVAALCPAIEVVTSAFGPAWVDAGALSLIADNGVHGALVLGSERMSWRELDLAGLRVVLTRNGREEGHGKGANALGHPLTALAWLANQGVRCGHGLKAGDIVTTGVVTPFIYCEAGDEVYADYADLGVVRLRFTE